MQAAILGSLVNGQIFREWVSPALFKAYQWQVSGTPHMSEKLDQIEL